MDYSWMDSMDYSLFQYFKTLIQKIKLLSQNSILALLLKSTFLKRLKSRSRTLNLSKEMHEQKCTNVIMSKCFYIQTQYYLHGFNTF